VLDELQDMKLTKTDTWYTATKCYLSKFTFGDDIFSGLFPPKFLIISAFFPKIEGKKERVEKLQNNK
jgi:hypothetical protein